MNAKRLWLLRRVPFLILAMALAAILLGLVRSALATQRRGSLDRVTWASDTLRDSTSPSLRADGTLVAFASNSDLLNEGRPGGVGEIWLYDTTTMTYTRITSASDNLRDSRRPSLSADGTVVAFDSDSDLLNEGIGDEVWEVWLWEEFDHVYLPLVMRNSL